MVSFQDIEIGFGGVRVLDRVSGSIERGERVGLVGPNGAGKSTLLRILAALERPERGEIRKPKQIRIGYLPQGGVGGSATSCMEEALEAFGDLADIEDELRQITRQLAELPRGGSVPEHLLTRYGELEHQFAHRGGYRGESMILRALGGLGIERQHWSRATAELSGGLRMRLALTKLVVFDHDLLLLDEPTNHLDIGGIEWLEEYLAVSPAAQILVSHDRRFLDRLVSEIWEIDHGSLTCYRGDYSRYLEEREHRRQLQIKRRNTILEERARLQSFINRNRARKDRARQVQGRIKALKRLEEIPLPPEIAESTFRLREAPPGDRIVVRLEGVGKSYGEGRVFQGLDLTVERGDRIAVVGPNGSGKSTLLRILVGREPPTEGSCWTSPKNVVRSYSQDEAESLAGVQTVLEEVERAAPVEMVPRARSLLATFLFRGDEVFKPLNALSGGERSRLALAKLMVEPVNFLVLDEPTNHLDQDGQAVLTEALEGYSGTLVFVSHDRYFVDRLAGRVIEIDSGRVRLFLGNYTDYRGSVRRAEAGEPFEASVEEKPTALRKPVREAATGRKRRLEEVEREIETIEARLGALEAMLASPKVFRSGELARKVVEEQRELKAELPALYERWEDLGRE